MPTAITIPRPKRKTPKKKVTQKKESINFTELYSLKKLANLRLNELRNERICSLPQNDLVAIYSGVLARINMLLDNEMRNKIIE